MQAFHWFANEDSLREIHRVLKPTGGFIMFANREDERDPWARAILCSFELYSKVGNDPCHRACIVVSARIAAQLSTSPFLIDHPARCDPAVPVLSEHQKHAA